MKTSEAVEFFGSKTNLAKALKVTKQALNRWGEEVPELRQYQIEVITERQLLSDFSKMKLSKGQK